MNGDQKITSLAVPPPNHVSKKPFPVPQSCGASNCENEPWLRWKCCPKELNNLFWREAESFFFPFCPHTLIVSNAKYDAVIFQAFQKNNKKNPVALQRNKYWDGTRLSCWQSVWWVCF